MHIYHVSHIAGTEFPAGRRTRVIVGPSAPVEAQNFVMGHVTIYPGGSVPLHAHEQEEVYFIASGEGVMTVNGEKQPLRQGSYVYIQPNSQHLLENTSSSDMVMIFVYAPKSIVDHWRQELEKSI